MNKKVAVAGLTLAAALTLAGVGTTLAQGTTYPSIVTKLAQRFNLDPAQINQVFKEERQAHQQQMQQKIETKLTQDVKDGLINQSQKDALTSKLSELQQKKSDLVNLPQAERRQQLKTLMDEFRSWAQNQGIDLKKLGIGVHGLRHFDSQPAN